MWQWSHAVAWWRVSSVVSGMVAHRLNYLGAPIYRFVETFFYFSNSYGVISCGWYDWGISGNTKRARIFWSSIWCIHHFCISYHIKCIITLHIWIPSRVVIWTDTFPGYVQNLFCRFPTGIPIQDNTLYRSVSTMDFLNRPSTVII